MGNDYVPQEYARKCTHCSEFASRLNDLTGVPESLRECDISKFDFGIYRNGSETLRRIAMVFINKFDEWAMKNKGLYIWSKTPGSGKTFLACCIGKSVMMRQQIRFRFVTAIDYINYVGESKKREPGTTDKSAIFRECEVLVLDDIGAQIGKEWQQQEMFRLINYRMEKGLPVIYTSNLPIESLNVDERSKSRIIKNSIVIQMPEESIRERMAIEEQNTFLRGILNA